MKIKRWITLAAVALLAVSALGALSANAFAQATAAPAAQTAIQTQDCTQDQADGADVGNAGPDSDSVDVQCGDQNAPDAAAGQAAEAATSADGQEAAPAGTPAITAAQAQQAALAAHQGNVVKTELDDENGTLVYSVQFDDNADVKVNALSGAVLGTETGQD